MTPEATPPPVPTIEELRSVSGRMTDVVGRLQILETPDAAALTALAQARITAADTIATTTHERVRGAIGRLASGEFAHLIRTGGLHAGNPDTALTRINTTFNGVAIFALNPGRNGVILQRLALSTAPRPPAVAPGEGAPLPPALQPFQDNLNIFAQRLAAAPPSQRGQMFFVAQGVLRNSPYALGVSGNVPILVPRRPGPNFPIIRPRVAPASIQAAPSGAPRPAAAPAPGPRPGPVPGPTVRASTLREPPAPTAANVDTHLRTLQRNLNLFAPRFARAPEAARAGILADTQRFLDASTPPGFPAYRIEVAGTPPVTALIPVVPDSGPRLETGGTVYPRETVLTGNDRRINAAGVRFTRAYAALDFRSLGEATATRLAVEQINGELAREGSSLRMRVNSGNIIYVQLNYAAGDNASAGTALAVPDTFALPRRDPSVDAAANAFRNGSPRVRALRGAQIQALGSSPPVGDAPPAVLPGDQVAQARTRASGAASMLALHARDGIDSRGRPVDSAVDGEIGATIRAFNEHAGNMVTLELRAPRNVTGAIRNLIIKPKAGVSLADLQEAFRGIATPLPGGEQGLMIPNIGTRDDAFRAGIERGFRNLHGLVLGRVRTEAAGTLRRYSVQNEQLRDRLQTMGYAPNANLINNIMVTLTQNLERASATFNHDPDTQALALDVELERVRTSVVIVECMTLALELYAAGSANPPDTYFTERAARFSAILPTIPAADRPAAVTVLRGAFISNPQVSLRDGVRRTLTITDAGTLTIARVQLDLSGADTSDTYPGREYNRQRGQNIMNRYTFSTMEFDVPVGPELSTAYIFSRDDGTDTRFAFTGEHWRVSMDRGATWTEVGTADDYPLAGAGVPAADIPYRTRMNRILASIRTADAAPHPRPQAN